MKKETLERANEVRVEIIELDLQIRKFNNALEKLKGPKDFPFKCVLYIGMDTVDVRFEVQKEMLEFLIDRAEDEKDKLCKEFEEL